MGFSNGQTPVFMPKMLASVALTVCTVLLRVYLLSTTTVGEKSLRAVYRSVGRLDYMCYRPYLDTEVGIRMMLLLKHPKVLPRPCSPLGERVLKNRCYRRRPTKSILSILGEFLHEMV